MSYSDILPTDIIFTIIKYLDKYDINKFIYSSKYITELFNNDNLWKEMLFFNLHNKVIINNYLLWRDNYFNNLNIEDKYNIKILNSNEYDYAILFRDLSLPINEIMENIDTFALNLARYYDNVAIIGFVYHKGKISSFDGVELESIISGISLRFGISKKNMIVIKLNKNNFVPLDHISYKYSFFDALNSYGIIIGCQINNKNIILLDAPKLE